MGYRCDCMMGYTGKDCEKIEWCEKNKEICGDTPCKLNENTRSGFCFCKDGLYFDAKTKTCKALNKCLFQRIHGNCTGDHETCNEKGNCICEENYAYNEDKTACEPDFCWKKSKKARCRINMECTAEEGGYSCSCKEGFRQIEQKCVKVDKCAPGISKCDQICNDGICTCLTGFKLSEDGYSCEPTEIDSECSLNCGKGVCVKTGTMEKCICPQISHVYKEKTCIDKCKAKVLKTGECPEGLGCLSNEEHGYICNCTGKYGFEDDGVHCKKKRMCSEGGGNEDCKSKGGVCEENFALPKGYTCKCKFGYKENATTHVCEHMCEKIDCSKKQALCTININNKAECICPPLLVKDADGSCTELAKYSYLGDFSVPKEKYKVITSTHSSRSKRDIFEHLNQAKLLKDFEDSMKTIFDDYKGTSILNCSDAVSDWKCFLEIKLDKNPEGKINITSTPSVCLPLSDESHCLIPPEFITRQRTADDPEVFRKTNPCDKGVTGNVCGDETECKPSDPSGFRCECKEGYTRRTFYVPAENVHIDICEDINECLITTICPNTTTCSNFPGDYTCQCKKGHRLEEGKSGKMDGCKPVCYPNPCNHGKCSESGQDGFSCSCEGLYSGRYCNQTNEALGGIKKSGTETSAIIGGVLGAFLVMSIIICIILFRKLRKSKSIGGSEDPMRHRNLGLVSDMWKLGRRQPENKDIELRDHERRPNRQNEEVPHNSQLRINPIDSITIPRPQLGRSTDKDVNSRRDMLEMRESGDYRRGDNRMFPQAHSSRHSGEAHRSNQRDDDRQELPRRPLARSSDHSDNEKVAVSRMQYRNRGYVED